jgi:hypothetical protein
VGIFGIEGLTAKVEGSLVRLRKFQGFLRKMILTPCCVSAVTLKNHIKSQKNPKKCKLNFVVLSVARTTTLSRYVCTFERQFLLEK